MKNIDVSALSKRELTELILKYGQGEKLPDFDVWPYSEARKIRDIYYGKNVFLRGLVEFTSYCKQDCLYCGLRRSNLSAKRYRLSREQILSCCETGYELGFRSFVLQGGEDAHITAEELCGTVKEIKKRFSNCALTLSVGEMSAENYKKLRKAGADRYLLRHETADSEHYSKLHPSSQTFEKRKECLYVLKETGFHTGVGFMVGSPAQTAENLAEDLLFIKEFQPHMVGIGPFMPHHATPFAAEHAGSVRMTLFMLAMVRLLLPEVLLPATTALSSVHGNGRILGLNAGANVIMSNISPSDVRKDYSIYDFKRVFGAEAFEGLALLKEELEQNEYIPCLTRGDYGGIENGKIT